MSEFRQFTKQALSIDQQIKLLESRGLIIDNPDRSRRYLRFIGYYRLSGYGRFFQLPTEKSGYIFEPETTFDHILNVYIFDRKLRLLIMDAIERIEVAIRSAISNTMSEQYGPHWFLDSQCFMKKFNHDELIEIIEKETGFKKQKKRNEICKHYYETYKDPKLPASWMIAEVLSLGQWSRIFDFLSNKKDKTDISKHFSLPIEVFTSWLRSLSYLRNLCAHHARVWNRIFTIKPLVIRKPKKLQKLLKQNHTFFAQAVIVNIFLSAITNNSRWQQRLLNLFKDYPEIPISEMGFPEKWTEDPFLGYIR